MQKHGYGPLRWSSNKLVAQAFYPPVTLQRLVSTEITSCHFSQLLCYFFCSSSTVIIDLFYKYSMYPMNYSENEANQLLKPDPSDPYVHLQKVNRVTSFLSHLLLAL